MDIRVTVDTAGLKKMRRTLTNNPRLVDVVLRDWLTIFRAYIRQRFYSQSRGAGEWPPLAAVTLRRRRGRGVGAAILRDTGALFAATQPSLGNGAALIQERNRRFLGFTAELNNGTQLGAIAGYHQDGEGRLPVRRILVDPPQNILNKMAAAAKKRLVEFLDG
jgi:hypothetical protein